MTKEEILKAKRQDFHRLLIRTGEVKHKELIVNAMYGVDSTTDLTENQLDKLIDDAQLRLNNSGKNKTYSTKASPEEQALWRKWRNKILLVLNERGITATPKDWSRVNSELAKPQYQWVLSDKQRAQGITNYKGLYTFTTCDNLKKLFQQLSSIRDNEQKAATKHRKLAQQN
jgi:hypothetical protein